MSLLKKFNLFKSSRKCFDIFLGLKCQKEKYFIKSQNNLLQ